MFNMVFDIVHSKMIEALARKNRTDKKKYLKELVAREYNRL